MSEIEDVEAFAHLSIPMLWIFAGLDGVKTKMIGVTLGGGVERAPRAAGFVNAIIGLTQDEVSAAWDKRVERPYTSSPTGKGYYLKRIEILEATSTSESGFRGQSLSLSGSKQKQAMSKLLDWGRCSHGSPYTFGQVFEEIDAKVHHRAVRDCRTTTGLRAAS